MTKNFNVSIAACAVLFAAFGLHATLGARAQAAAAGVYTEAQAMRGATLYAEQCAACHGEDKTGVADLEIVCGPCQTPCQVPGDAAIGKYSLN